MAFQPETTIYPAGIYQLETADPVLGGPGGVDNSPLLALACRTNYLKAQTDALNTAVQGLAPINSPQFTGTPLAPTAAASNNSTAISNTAFAQRARTGTTALTGLTGGTVALTADQASVPNLTLSGTLTSNFVVTIPTAQAGLLRVTNNTTGAFTVTIKTPGGNGIVVAQSTYTFVFNDGTNVVDGFTSASAMNFAGAVAIANNTPIAWKDTGGVARRMAMLNAGSSMYFGDIDNVLSGGTTQLLANTMIQLNLNGSPLGYLTSNGFGVGAAPAYRVHATVSGANSEIRATTISAGDALVSVEAVGVMSASMVARRASSLLAFNIVGTDVMTLKNDASMTLGAVSRVQAFNVAGNVYALNASGASVTLADQYNSVVLKSTPDSSVSASHMDLVASGGLVMRLQNDGRALIGTTSGGNFQLGVQAASGRSGILVSGAAGLPMIQATDGNVVQFAAYTNGSGTNAVAYSGTQTAHPYAITVNNSEQWRISVAGNIAHGGNESAVSGYRTMAITGSTGALIDLLYGSTAGGRISAQASGLGIDSSGARPTIFYINGAEAGRFGASAGFAVNTAETPASITTGRQEGLRMIGDSAALTGYNSAGSTRTGYLQFNTGSSVLLAAENGASIAFSTGGGIRAMLDTSGNLGLGTTNPGAFGKLAVVGNITSLDSSLSTVGGFNQLLTGLAITSFKSNGSPIIFSNSNASGGVVENGRFAISGNFLLGTSTDSGAARLQVAGAISATGTVGAQFFQSQGRDEGARLVYDSAYLSFYNSANSTRTGYLQGNATTGIFANAEVGSYQINSNLGSVSLLIGGTVKFQVTNAGVIQDGAGKEIGYKGIPQATSFVNGQCWIATSGVTVPTMAAEVTTAVYNNSASAITITQGSGLTLRQAGTTNTGNRTLAPRGYASIYFISAGEAIVSGAGLT